MSIEMTPEGFWVICGETHLNRWVRESRRLDHDMYSIPIACSHIVPGTVVIDVGANIGDHTIAYLRTVKDGIVVAYEPHPDAFECLLRNCPDAVPKQCAVGDRIGFAYLHALTDNVGMSHLSAEGVKVNITTLDHDFSNALMPNGQRISFIKIDVEGSEPEVLLGATRILAMHRPVLMMEVNISALSRQGHSPSELSSLLDANRYSVEFLPPAHSWASEQSDILCRPL